MKRVLIADPSIGVRGWLQSVLAPAGTVHTESAWEAMYELADDDSFDLIVASRWLPGMPGPQLLASLRTVGIQIPFVLLAPLCRDNIRAIVRRAGRASIADDPFDAHAIGRAIAEVLGPAGLAEGTAPWLRTFASEQAVAG